MGTRNLTMVYLDGEYKVAQYGQWDGYPDGQGITVLGFLRETMDKEKFIEKLRASVLVNQKWLEEKWIEYGANEDDMIKMDDADRFNKAYPHFIRNTGAGILEIIQESEPGIALQVDINFAADSLYCEWLWLIDFDAGTFEGYIGFNQCKLSENDRFYFLEDKSEHGYYPVRLAASFQLDDLPTKEDFLAAFKEDDDE